MIARPVLLRRRRARGATLIELTLALAISAILLLATTSVVLLAANAVPVVGDTPSSEMAAAAVLDRMASELETAVLVLAQTTTSITFLVPPRNGDAWPERISYAWGGTAGMPLTRQYNGGSVVNLIDSVNQFSLTPVIATNSESYPGQATEDTTESLLMDYSSTAGQGSFPVNSNNWPGQVFASSTWPAGVVGWRPTRATVYAQQSSLVGISNVQLRPALAALTPASNSLAQVSMVATALSSSYSLVSASFSGIARYAPAAPLDLILQWSVGIPNSINAATNNSAGLLQTNNAGTAWTYASNKGLISQMYGTLSHAGPTQYALSRYDSAVQMTLRAGVSTNPAVTTTAQTLNHPELLSAFWELKFNTSPTTADSNGDGVADWVVDGGGTFNTASVSNNTWVPGGTQLDSQPGDNFARLTVVDVRFRGTSNGSSAGIKLNAARSGSICAPVLAQITVQSDGYQTLSVWRKLNDSTTDTLLTIPNLPPTPVDLHLIIDPTVGSVGIRVNNVEYGSFAYNLYSSSDSLAVRGTHIDWQRGVRLRPCSGGTAMRDYRLLSPRYRCTERRARGFTIVEVTISTIIVSVMMVGAIRGVAACKTMRYRMAERARGQLLAMDLLSEVLQQSYSPPATPDPTGPTRAGWTCVDDYNSYVESPPTTKAGNTIPDVTGLTRTVTVSWMDPVALVSTASTNTGVKQITVTVQRGNLVLASAAGYRTLGWVDAVPSPGDATGNHPPTAVATFTPAAIKAGQVVNFSGASSSDSDGNTLSYTWKFGDGTTAAGVTTTHTYSADGTYAATLTVYDGYGGVGISTLSISVVN